MTKIGKNGQKNGKNCIKIDFLYNNFPEKVISLRKCTKKKIAFCEKKSQKFLIMCGTPPPRRGLYKLEIYRTLEGTGVLPHSVLWGFMRLDTW